MTDGEPFAPIVAFIVGQPGLAQKMLAQHRDDGTGHCEVCTEGGQAGHKVWPCPSFGLAQQATARR